MPVIKYRIHDCRDSLNERERSIWEQRNSLSVSAAILPVRPDGLTVSWAQLATERFTASCYHDIPYLLTLVAVLREAKDSLEDRLSSVEADLRFYQERERDE